MVGKQHSQQILAEAAEQADIILIEGVMGLFDGEPSTADLAAAFGIPILAVIDASAMAQTFAAIAVGLDHYRQDTQVAAVIANKAGSERHADMLKNALPPTLPCLATLYRQTEHALPSRYLGLQQASEIKDLEQRLSHTLEAFDFDDSVSLPNIDFPFIDTPQLPALLDGLKIGIAKDAAFSFLYQANLDCLVDLGAELIFFSPLTDQSLPEIDSLYLPGGYPELHLDKLSQNTSMIQSIHQHYHANKSILAECVGMLYLCDSLTDKSGNKTNMCGVLPAQAKLQARLTALGLQEVRIEGAAIRGHTYHHSSLSTELVSEISGQCPNGKSVSEAVYQQERLTASYIHFYFYSNPHLIAAWLSP